MPSVRACSGARSGRASRASVRYHLLDRLLPPHPQPRRRPLVGTPVPAVTSTCATSETLLTPKVVRAMYSDPDGAIFDDIKHHHADLLPRLPSLSQMFGDLLEFWVILRTDVRKQKDDDSKQMAQCRDNDAPSFWQQSYAFSTCPRLLPLQIRNGEATPTTPRLNRRDVAAKGPCRRTW